MRRTTLWMWLGAWSLVFAAAAHAEEAAAVAAAPAAPDANGARKAEAEQCRLLALQLYDAGNYAAARTEFARANQLMPSYRLLYNLGVVSLDLADPANAYDYFSRYLAAGGTLIPPEKRSETLTQLQDLASRIATITVFVDTAGAEILIDDQSVGTSLAVVHANPGRHEFVARRASARSETKVLVVRAGDSLRVDLKLNPASTTLRSIEPRRRVFWPGWAGSAALTAGAVFAGLEALSAQHEYNQQLGGISSRTELNRLDRNATRWSVTADALSGAAIVLGACSLYLSLRHAPARATGPNSSGAFSVQVLENQARASVRF